MEPFCEEVLEEDEDEVSFFRYSGDGPQILTLASSDTEASMEGCFGFQVTQLTVLL